MSLSTPATSISQFTTNSETGKSDTFQDLPIISRQVRLNIFEMENSDKQIINELIYRFCRILTRKRTCNSECRVLILDTIGAINPVRMGSILKRDSARLRKIHVVRQCKINSAFLTLSAYINKEAIMQQPKLIVIYQDEFYITKTLRLLENFVLNSKSQVIMVLPKLSRTDRDMLHLMPANQILKCDFVVDRREIAPAPSDNISNASYQKYLNHIYFQRFCKSKNLPDRIEGTLTEEGLHLIIFERPHQHPRVSMDSVDFLMQHKKIKLDQSETKQSES